MSRSYRTLSWSLAVGLAAVAAPVAQAQFAPPQSPAVSPYLNLLRNGSPMFLNYYGLVQPQIQAQQQLQNLQNQVQGLDAALSAGGAGGSGASTGHPWGYFTHRGYFLNNRSGNAGGGGLGMPGGGSVGGNPIGGAYGGQNLSGFGAGGANTGGFGTNPYGNPRGVR